MSDDLVERLARAICLDLGDDPDELCVLIAGREGTRPAWEGFVSTTTAVLAEIEAAGYAVVPVEPTAEMEAAGNEPLSWVMTSAGTVWRAMLAASRKKST